MAEQVGLAVRSLRKRFGGTLALDDVSFAAGGGEFVTLLGPSGCGKTTLLRIIAGLERADGGTVALAGRDLSDLPPQRRPVNTVFQSYALFPHLTVHGNVAFGLRARRVGEAEVRSRVADTLARLRIDDLAERRPDQLSGGQRQRVALARALVNEPQLLLLDEPMSALDAQLRGALQIELRRLQRTLGTTFLLVTHDQDEAMTVSDRLIVMERGRIAQIGTPAELYQRPANRFVAGFLGAANLIEVRRTAEPSLVTSPFGLLRLAAPLPRERATLAIRPEHVGVSPAGDAVNAVLSSGRDAVFRGDHVDLIDPCGLRARVASTARVADDRPCFLCLPPEHLCVLDD